MLNRIITERLTVRKTDAEIEKILHPETKIEEKKVATPAEPLEVLDLDDDTDEGGKNKKIFPKIYCNISQNIVW